MSYKPKNFSGKELVSPAVYNELGGDIEKISRLFNQEFLQSVDELVSDVKRDLGAKSAVCNTWGWGGNFDDRGYRGKDSNTGTLTSSHRSGKAIDLEFFDAKKVEIDTQKVIDYLIKGKKEGKYKGIRRVELGNTWNHFDCVNVGYALFGFHMNDSKKNKVLIA